MANSYELNGWTTAEEMEERRNRGKDKRGIYDADPEIITAQMDKFTKIARRMKVTVRYDDTIPYDLGGIGLFNPFGGFECRITMGGLLEVRDDHRTIITLLHEMGHYYDYIAKGTEWRKFAREQPRWEPEISAWREGMTVGLQVGFTEWNVYFEHMIECLSSYSEGEHENAKVAAMGLRKELVDLKAKFES